MVCKNCGNTFIGKFCNNCGQKANVKRLNWQYLLQSFNNNVLQIDHGFLYTIKTLLSQPGESLIAFFEGKRKSFQNPMTFLFLSAALYLISSKFFGNDTFVNSMIRGFMEGGGNKAAPTQFKEFVEYILKNQTFVFLATVPLYSIASYLSFYTSRFNFTEHLVLNTYILGLQLLSYTFFSFISNRMGMWILLPLIIGFLINVYVYSSLFKQLVWWERILRFILTYFLYLLLILIPFVSFTILLKL